VIAAGYAVKAAALGLHRQIQQLAGIELLVAAQVVVPRL
jgi:hypothetical protein